MRHSQQIRAMRASILANELPPLIDPVLRIDSARWGSVDDWQTDPVAQTEYRDTYGDASIAAIVVARPWQDSAEEWEQHAIGHQRDLPTGPPVDDATPAEMVE